LEEAGVLVMATERSQVPVDEMRGFSLYFDEVPVIMLTGADAPRGRMFSLLHEYVHLLLLTEGLCDTTTDMRATTPDRAIEARCNAVAAAILMPRQDVLSAPLVARHKTGEAWTLSDLIDAAKPFGVSVEAFHRRLVTLGRVPLKAYLSFRDSQDVAPRSAPRGDVGEHVAVLNPARNECIELQRRVLTRRAHTRTQGPSTPMSAPSAFASNWCNWCCSVGSR